MINQCFFVVVVTFLLCQHGCFGWIDDNVQGPPASSTDFEGSPDDDGITGDTILEFLQDSLSALKEDADFRFGSEWRDESGRLKKMTMVPPQRRSSAKNGHYDTLSVNSCGSLTGIIDGSGSGSVSYEYSYCSGCVHDDDWFNTCSEECGGRPMFACIYVHGNYDKINMNYNSYQGTPINRNIAVSPASLGATCTDCYAYVGANMGFLLYCTSSYCMIDFEAGGAAKFNIDLQINEPNLNTQTTTYTPLGPTLNFPLADSEYVTLGTFSTWGGTEITIEVATDIWLGKFFT